MVSADHLLLSRWIAERDAQAFKTLSMKYCAMVYGTCVRILRNAADAEDMTQECFAALASASQGPQGSMGAWLHRIATYQALNHRRSDQRRREREEEFARARSTMSDAQWDDISQFIDQSIEALPDKIRVAVVAHFIEDQPVTAIAAREGVTHSAISQRLQKGVTLIRDRMRQNGIPIGAAALATMMAQRASAWPAVPPLLSARLGKLALTGRTATGKLAPPQRGIPTMKTAVIAALTLAATTLVGFALMASDPVTAVEVDSAPPLANADVSPMVVTASSSEANTEPALANKAPKEVVRSDSSAAESAQPDLVTWKEVVDAYAAHQDRIRRISFDYENASKGTYLFQSYSPDPGYREFYERGSLITDGDRCSMKHNRWGHNFADELPADRPDFIACAYNGDTYVQYTSGGGEFYGNPGAISITPGAMTSRFRESLFKDGRNYLIFGRYPCGSMLGLPLISGWRMEEFLRNANKIALRPEKEVVDGLQCYVIDADTGYGDFTVWFSPERDYNVMRSIVRLSAGDIYESSPMLPTTSAYYEYNATKFAQVDGLWLPLESTSRQTTRLLQNGGHDYMHYHRRFNVKLLSDGEDKDAYAIDADDIVEGSELLQVDVVLRKGDPRWRWFDGEFWLVSDEPGTDPPKRSIGGRSFGAGVIGCAEY